MRGVTNVACPSTLRRHGVLIKHTPQETETLYSPNSQGSSQTSMKLSTQLTRAHMQQQASSKYQAQPAWCIIKVRHSRVKGKGEAQQHRP